METATINYEVSVMMPRSYGPTFGPAGNEFYEASQENVDDLFDMGATEMALYVVTDTGNRKLVKYFFDASCFADALRFAKDKYAAG